MSLACVSFNRRIRATSKGPFAKFIQQSAAISAFLSLLLSGAAGNPLPERDPQIKHNLQKLFREIHCEVKEMGKYPGEDFIQWEFHIGPADDDTNQEDHLVILIQDIAGRKKMTIQVTHLEPSKFDANIRYGKETKKVICLIDEASVDVSRSDYDEKGLHSLLPDVLKAVKDKKNLIKLIKK